VTATRIFLVDDHMMFRSGVRAELDRLRAAGVRFGVLVELENSEAQANRAAAEAFMAAYVDGARQLDEEGWYHDESLELIEEFTGQDPDVISIGRPPVQPPDLPVDFDQWRGYQEFFLEIGVLEYDEPIDVEGLWDLSLRDAVVDGN
jgi:ABC-type nitrate/sulfonate/bicarbonate transport system substrate-binding protein